MNIDYNGRYPNLCSGQLIVTIDGVEWRFPEYCLRSGGSCYFTNNYRDEHVKKGDWSVTDWPEGFPEDQKEAVINEINAVLPKGCCGGCI